MMFERFFQWALKHGPRLLVAFAAIILLVNVLQALNAVAPSVTGRSTTYGERLMVALSQGWPTSLSYLWRGLSSAALPFFGALVIHRIDLWRQRSVTAVAPDQPVAAPSWMARHGARLLLALSLPYFLIALLGVVVLLGQMGSSTLPAMLFDAATWQSSLWSASLLLCGSLVLDRLDHWR